MIDRCRRRRLVVVVAMTTN
uniref:Uncharacterized protein n=1 Tax=Arundo donax TaxID=35708 RepID=A0A0A9HN72_ARUDO